MLAVNTRVDVSYPNGSRPVYSGYVEKDNGVNLTVKLLDKDEKGRDQFRSFLKSKIRDIRFPR